MKETATKAVEFAKDRPIAAIGIGVLTLIGIGLGIKAAVSDKKSP